MVKIHPHPLIQPTTYADRPADVSIRGHLGCYVISMIKDCAVAVKDCAKDCAVAVYKFFYLRIHSAEISDIEMDIRIVKREIESFQRKLTELDDLEKKIKELKSSPVYVWDDDYTNIYNKLIEIDPNPNVLVEWGVDRKTELRVMEPRRKCYSWRMFDEEKKEPGRQFHPKDPRPHFALVYKGELTGVLKIMLTEQSKCLEKLQEDLSKYGIDFK